MSLLTDAENDPSCPVRFDHATLRSEPAGTHTRYTVSLTALPGEGWHDAYAAASEQAGLLRAFPLDRGRGTVSFSCRIVEGPAHVIEMLERLEELLVAADKRYDAWLSERSAPPASSALAS
jgi:hypothetical protein